MLTGIISIIILLLWRKRQRQKQQRRIARRKYRVDPFNDDRFKFGQFHTHYCRLRNNPKKFFGYYRMSIKSFDELVQILKNDLIRTGNRNGDGISAEERMTVTLRYLATGKNFKDIAFDFMIGNTTVNQIVRETCQIIWNKLYLNEMPMPTTSMWIQNAQDFYANSQFPNCIGAIDGKHIRLMNPRKCGSLFYNYKKYSSIVLLAVADANYCFTSIDVGAYGREGDSQIFKRSNFGKRLRNGTLNIPDDRALPNSTDEKFPFVFVGDEAFGIQNHLMRPYPSSSGLSSNKKIFNYRLSRARRFVECTFGILSHKWRIFQNALLVQPEFAVDIIKAACVLHNFVRKRDGFKFHHTLVNSLDADLTSTTGRSPQALLIRDKFSHYFASPEGSLQWQTRYI